MSNSKELVKLLNNGILPDQLNFGLEKSAEFDINDLKFNWFYRDYTFYESKFPQGYQNIPGFENIIQSIADNQTKTPLEEITERQNSDICKPFNEGENEIIISCISTIGQNRRKKNNSPINIDDKISP
jgi:hypothetical protein